MNISTTTESTGLPRVGFDLGGTNMRAVLYDAAFKPVGRASKRHKQKSGEQSGSGIKRMTALIEKALASVPAAETSPALGGIGIACPGTVNPASGDIYELTNLGWPVLAVRAPLQKRFGCPVHVLNDVDAGTYGEYCFGAGRGAECVLGVFPGTGVGGGCVRSGVLMQAREVSCFEIGHLAVMPGGALCGCGQRGCLETLAGRLAISQAAAAAVYRGEAPNLAAETGTNLAMIRSGALARAIDAGDKVIETIVTDAACWLGVGIASVVNLLAPDCIVLGGGLVEAMPVLYRDVVEDTVRRRVMRAYRKRFKVVVASLGDDAVAQGAAAWSRRQTGQSGDA